MLEEAAQRLRLAVGVHRVPLGEHVEVHLVGVELRAVHAGEPARPRR